MVVFGGSYGIGADIADVAREYGAEVFTFSRSSTNTQVERREDIRAAVADVLAATGRVDYVVNTAAVLPARAAHRDQRGDGLGGHRDQLRRAGDDRAGVLPAPAGHAAAACSTSRPAPTRAAGSGYSLYSSAKAAVVNLTQALADEWSGDGDLGQLHQPRAHRHPDAHQGVRRTSRPASLLESTEVARRSLDVLVSGETGLIIDIRRDDPLSPKAALEVDDLDDGPADA